MSIITDCHKVFDFETNKSFFFNKLRCTTFFLSPYLSIQHYVFRKSFEVCIKEKRGDRLQLSRPPGRNSVIVSGSAAIVMLFSKTSSIIQMSSFSSQCASRYQSGDQRRCFRHCVLESPHLSQWRHTKVHGVPP